MSVNPIPPIIIKKRRERIIAVASIVLLIGAWIIGYLRASAAVEPYLLEAMPEAASFTEAGQDVFQALSPTGEVIGYVAINEASGYGGPMKLAVAVDLDGLITGLAVIDSKETPSYFDRVIESDFISELVGKSAADDLTLEDDIDAVSGATFTSRAMADATRKAAQAVATGKLGMSVPGEVKPKVHFGLPEILLVLVFGLSFLARNRKFENPKTKKLLRWATLILGLAFMGFLFNQQLTILKINTYLMGYWPQWQTNLYWYILLGVILFSIVVEKQNTYCYWFCPFGAAQELLAQVGGGKPYYPKGKRETIIWAKRGIAFLALFVALIFRNPALTSFEIFGTLFGLTGTTLQFIILGVILLMSFFLMRPWCNYFCPVDVLIDYGIMIRRWGGELWPKKQKNKA